MVCNDLDLLIGGGSLSNSFLCNLNLVLLEPLDDFSKHQVNVFDLFGDLVGVHALVSKSKIADELLPHFVDFGTGDHLDEVAEEALAVVIEEIG